MNSNDIHSKNTTTVTLSSLKYDQHTQYEWEAFLYKKTEEYMITIAPPGRKLLHHGKNKIITFDTWGIEVFPFRDWYTASASVDEKGNICEYYCNLCMPSILKGDRLSFIDLDLDYVNEDGNWKVVDQDEFAENQIKYAYPQDLIEKARLELDKLIERVSHNKFPFDGTFNEIIKKAL